jgi:ribosome-associated protein
MELDAMKKAVIDALEDIKAQDISVLDVAKLTPITSCMIIASATSTRQAKSLAHNVQVKMKEHGITPTGVEGEQEGEWVLVDLGEIVVHIMLQNTRDYYNLEQLWGATENRRQSLAGKQPAAQ